VEPIRPFAHATVADSAAWVELGRHAPEPLDGFAESAHSFVAAGFGPYGVPFAPERQLSKASAELAHETAVGEHCRFERSSDPVLL
jgi:hypothetical protein